MGMCNMHYERVRLTGDSREAGQERHPNGTISQWIKDHLSKEGWGEDCIIFPFSGRNPKGYAVAKIGGKVRTLHRYVLIETSGHEGGMALHSLECTDRACINPNHLRWGSAKENYEDAMKLGTHRNTCWRKR